jgi:putative glycosyltransferase (TIGR04372 family)
LQIRPARSNRGALLLSPTRVIGLLAVALAVLPVILVRLIRPIVLIRFGGLPTQRIGAFAVSTETYLCERDAGMHAKRSIDIFYHHAQTCNEQLKKMWNRRLTVSWLALFLARANLWLPGGSAHKVPWRRQQERDVYGLLAETPIHVSFTDEEERAGQTALKEMGVDGDTQFIGFHARDSAYLASTFPGVNNEAQDYRNSNIENYIPAAEKMASRGYMAFRMGAVVEGQLNTGSPMVIDYARDHRTEFLDVYMAAKCRFFICSATGMNAFVQLFRRPTAYVNFVSLEWAYTWAPDDLFIPKMVFSQQENRLLSFREVMESGIGRFTTSVEYQDQGLKLVENTPEEITDLAVEMDERLDGIWQPDPEDEELQQRFWSLYKQSDLNQVFRLKIGARFLAANQLLLD